MPYAATYQAKLVVQCRNEIIQGLQTSAEHCAEALAIFSTGRVLAGILRDVWRTQFWNAKTKTFLFQCEDNLGIVHWWPWANPRMLHNITWSICMFPVAITKTTRLGSRCFDWWRMVWSIVSILLELLFAECLCPRMLSIFDAPRFRDDLFGLAALWPRCDKRALIPRIFDASDILTASCRDRREIVSYRWW